MHIAICDDNIADRKHLERLLQRESDRRKNTKGILYIDSYGNVDALTKSPMIYDLFFIDMTQLPPHGMETAILLREVGVTAPIVLCTSSIRYEDYAKPPTGLIYINKPFKTEELTAIVDSVEVRKKNTAPTIEIRDDLNTPDSEFSMEPHEFKQMVDAIRNVEKALGSNNFELTEKMIINQDFSRSLFVVEDMKKVML